MVNVILLSGGSGTRLWPLSNATRSKQFLKVLRDREGGTQSMVQRTVEMVRSAIPDSRLVISASASQEPSITAQVDGEYDLVLEPERRDTAPAIMLAVSYLVSEKGVGPDEPIVVLPIDSYADEGYYRRVSKLADAVTSVSVGIALMGVVPSEPTSKYGYIVPGKDLSNEMKAVTCFKEKPARADCERLISEGALWNCGVFAFTSQVIVEVIGRYLPACDYPYLLAHYEDLPRISFDYEVVEHAASVGVIPFDGTWKDLGTWGSLTEEMGDAVGGNVVMGDCSNTHAINELALPLVVLGIDDAVVVTTPDGLLVSSKQASANLKPYVEHAAEHRAMCEKRKWGEYRILDYSVDGVTGKTLTKRLLVKRGKQISYQRHRCRNEVWTIVDGKGRVVLEGEERRVGIGDTVVVRSGLLHAVYADTDLSIIEVQTGTLLEEEDIERLGYYWDENGVSVVGN